MKGYCVGLLVVCCIIAMIGCGMTIVKEYTLSKEYEETVCDVSDIIDRGEIECEDCESTQSEGEESETNCYHSSFPCFSIEVFYQIGPHNQTGILHTSALQITDYELVS